MLIQLFTSVKPRLRRIRHLIADELLSDFSRVDIRIHSADC